MAVETKRMEAKTRAPPTQRAAVHDAQRENVERRRKMEKRGHPKRGLMRSPCILHGRRPHDSEAATVAMFYDDDEGHAQTNEEPNYLRTIHNVPTVYHPPCFHS